MLYAIIGFLVAIGILVVVHEYGHYSVARLLGVKVLRFSIGFGPIIARFRTGADQTEWAVSAIPLGGYVKMLDATTATDADRHRAIEALAPIRRMAIVIAGPAANFIFAVLACWIVAVIGTRELLPKIDKPVDGAPAAAAGLAAGDRIVAIDGKTIHTWQDLSMSIISGVLSRSRLDLTIRRNQIEQRRTVDFRDFRYEVDETDLIGKAGFKIQPPTIAPVVKTVMAGEPADRAGVLPGDRIVSLNDDPIDDWQVFVEKIRQMPNQQASIGVRRGESLHQLSVAVGEKALGERVIGQVGLVPVIDASPIDQISAVITFGPVDGFFYAIDQVVSNISATMRFLGTMIAGRISSANLSGPIAIADYAGQSVQMGFDSFFKFLALVSVGLGVINLIPLPPFDGGHLVFHALEAIRGKPLSSHSQTICQAMGLLFVILLALLVLYNDIDRYFIGPFE